MLRMTSPALDTSHPAFVEDCEPCRTLGGPCRAHFQIYENAAESLVADLPTEHIPDCGKRGCENPVLHSHKAKDKTAPHCPYGQCRQREDHRHTEDGGIQRLYSPRPPVEDFRGTVTREPVQPVLAGIPPEEIPSIEPIYSEDPLKPGMWVHVWANVTDRQTHPDDVVVRIFEHNADSLVTVARDRVVGVEGFPEFSTQCGALRYEQGLLTGGVYVRCTSYDAEGHAHRDADVGEWPVEAKIRWMDEE
jgi:hypothetical protein